MPRPHPTDMLSPRLYELAGHAADAAAWVDNNTAMFPQLAGALLQVTSPNHVLVARATPTADGMTIGDLGVLVWADDGKTWLAVGPADADVAASQLSLVNALLRLLDWHTEHPPDAPDEHIDGPQESAA